MVDPGENKIEAAGSETKKQAYEKPCMTEHEPLEEATAYVYYSRVLI
jgi:hypothetical protein